MLLKRSINVVRKKGKCVKRKTKTSPVRTYPTRSEIDESSPKVWRPEMRFTKAKLKYIVSLCFSCNFQPVVALECFFLDLNSQRIDSYFLIGISDFDYRFFVVSGILENLSDFVELDPIKYFPKSHRIKNATSAIKVKSGKQKMLIYGFWQNISFILPLCWSKNDNIFHIGWEFLRESFGRNVSVAPRW